MLRVYNRRNELGLEWNVEEKLPYTSLEQIANTEVVLASGRELSWVINTFVNIPHHREAEPQIWTGDFARFIVAHLPAKE